MTTEIATVIKVGHPRNSAQFKQLIADPKSANDPQNNSKAVSCP
jgi:hypothetical protein